MGIKRTEQVYKVMDNGKKWIVSSGAGKNPVVYEVTKVDSPTRGSIDHFMVKTV